MADGCGEVKEMPCGVPKGHPVSPRLGSHGAILRHDWADRGRFDAAEACRGAKWRREACKGQKVDCGPGTRSRWPLHSRSSPADMSKAWVRA